MTIFETTGHDILNTLNNDNNNNNEEKIDFKRLYINLKDGESVNIRFLGEADVVQYKSHGEYSLSLYNQTCTKKKGSCAYCQACDYAKKNGMEDWSKIYAKNRFLFGMFDLDKQEIRIFNASKTQAKTLFSTITEYKEDLDSVMFKLSRTGDKVETTYTLSPQLRIKNEEHKRAFDKASSLKVTEDVFENALIVRSRKGQIKQLKELGFPVQDVFKDDLEEQEQQEAPIVEIQESQLPF